MRYWKIDYICRKTLTYPKPGHNEHVWVVDRSQTPLNRIASAQWNTLCQQHIVLTTEIIGNAAYELLSLKWRHIDRVFGRVGHGWGRDCKRVRKRSETWCLLSSRPSEMQTVTKQPSPHGPGYFWCFSLLALRSIGSSLNSRPPNSS